MPWYDWLFVILSIYGVIGIASAVFFWLQAPYATISIGLLIILFWPVFWGAVIFQ